MEHRFGGCSFFDATILGESQRKIMQRVRRVTGQSAYQAKRVAQTERNRVQSQARWDAAQQAEQQGVRTYNEWRCRFVNSRDAHMERHGKRVLQGQTFPDSVMRYPGDPNGSAKEVINCHCYLQVGVLLHDETLDENGNIVKAENLATQGIQGQNGLQNRTEKGIIGVGDNTPGFKAIQGEHDISDDIGTMQNPTCNPNFSTGQWGYTQNCQRCVQAYELRRRGYNVVATKRPKKNNTIVWGYECFTDENGNPVNFVHGQTVSMIKKVLNSAPDGSRYTIYVKWKGRGTGAHVFIAEKENGVARYIDPQSGNMNVADYFNRGSTFGYFRMDDKKLTTDQTIINAAMEEKK